MFRLVSREVRILQQSFAITQVRWFLAVTGLKIVHTRDSPAFSTLLLLLAHSGLCETAVVTVARRCSVGIQYNGSTSFIKKLSLLCCALQGLQRFSAVAAAVCV